MWIARGPILRGWALAAQGQAAAGLAQIRQGMATWQAMGAQTRMLHMTYDAALMAEYMGRWTGLQRGSPCSPRRWRIAHPTGERFYEAELHRLKGEFATVRSPGPKVWRHDARRWKRQKSVSSQALEIARDQQAKSLELRAAMSLARLWQQQGKRAAARELLAPIYGWFTEGFDTADLQDAKALLEELT